MLAIAVGLTTLIGVSFATVPFIRSLNPTEAAKDRARVEIDLSRLAPGEFLTERTPFGELWVLRRTTEQIQWLSMQQPIQSYDFVEMPKLPEGVDPQTRSASPEFLVVSIWKDGDGPLLQMERAYYRCGEFEYFPEERRAAHGTVLPGGFICSGDRNEQFEDHPFVYDIAGRSHVKWVAPLYVPRHYFKQNGILVVGPEP